MRGIQPSSLTADGRSNIFFFSQGLKQRTACNEASAASACACLSAVRVRPLNAAPDGTLCFRSINQMLIRKIAGVALAVGQLALSSWVMAASLAPGITSALRPPRPALIHLLATCLWSFSHLDLFASHHPQHPCTCSVAPKIPPTRLFIRSEQQRPASCHLTQIHN